MGNIVVKIRDFEVDDVVLFVLVDKGENMVSILCKLDFELCM